MYLHFTYKFQTAIWNSLDRRIRNARHKKKQINKEKAVSKMVESENTAEDDMNHVAEEVDTKQEENELFNQIIEYDDGN